MHHKNKAMTTSLKELQKRLKKEELTLKANRKTIDNNNKEVQLIISNANIGVIILKTSEVHRTNNMHIWIPLCHLIFKMPNLFTHHFSKVYMITGLCNSSKKLID